MAQPAALLDKELGVVRDAEFGTSLWRGSFKLDKGLQNKVSMTMTLNDLTRSKVVTTVQSEHTETPWLVLLLLSPAPAYSGRRSGYESDDSDVPFDESQAVHPLYVAWTSELRLRL
ncbi:hypothetical protein HDU89_004307 [Geranomyces variabilis]|nr:hypothetical protein HDU89_004307 [Geranomyces variabilis]